MWIQRKGIRPELVILTHNDADHIEGFLALMRLVGTSVQKYGMVQDRDASTPRLKRIVRELLDGVEKYHWCEAFGISPLPDQPQDLLSGVSLPLGLQNKLKLQAIHPSVLRSLEGQAKGPNWAGAIIVLFYQNVPCVVWPGDQPLQTCHDRLQTYNIEPFFFVGPHHGGPVDSPKLSSDEMGDLVERIGHRESWISVGQKHRLPHEDYIHALHEKKISIRCSQVTCHCHPDLKTLGEGLLPTHDWLGLDRPPKGPSCMGPMRVVFRKSDYDIRFSEEHAKSLRKLATPHCVD